MSSAPGGGKGARHSEIIDVQGVYATRWSQEEIDAMGRIWKVLVHDYFQQFVPADAVVLDLGAGFCHFVNSIDAKRRIALDANPDMPRFAASGVEAIVSDDLSLSMFADGELTHVFMSNFLEHLSSPSAVIELMKALNRKVAPDGAVLILQPNFRYVGPAYFDFIDHTVVLTDRSLVEAIEIGGMSVKYMRKRFLPYTSKSRLPKSPALTRAYLRLPILHRFLGGQIFVVAR